MQPSLNARDHEYYETSSHSTWRGLATLVGASVFLVGAAYLGMILLTSPNSWMAEATLTSFQGEEPELVAVSERTAW